MIGFGHSINSFYSSKSLYRFCSLSLLKRKNSVFTGIMTKQAEERVHDQLHRLNDLIAALIQQESIKRMAVSEVCKKLGEECSLEDPLLMERDKREKIFSGSGGIRRGTKRVRKFLCL